VTVKGRKKGDPRRGRGEKDRGREKNGKEG